MENTDTWDKDPSVLRTRTYFSKMEILDRQFIRQYKIPGLDPRIRSARKLRLHAFETACALAVEKNISLDENTWQSIFILCQDLAFKKFNLMNEPILVADQPELLALVMESFK